MLIAGGGIGGVAAALALAQHGRSVTVFEKTGCFGEIGAGIQLGPNAFHCFDTLGIGDKAREIATRVDALKLLDAMSGRDIATVSLGGGFQERFGNPYAVVHRGELHRLMVAACESLPGVRLETDRTVSGYAIESDGSVAVAFDDGQAEQGSALVGADGLWSKVRQQVVGDGPPRISGHTTYRSVLPVDDVPEALRWNAAVLWAGPRCHIVHYPLSGWRSFNLVVTYHNHAPAVVAGESVAADEVSRGFEGVNSRVRALIEAGSEWKKWVLCDREPVASWRDGPVVLLGDAAHPMMQYMAQGACMALEDAVALARCIASGADDPGAAFAQYEQQRIIRTSRVVLGSRMMGDHVYHPDGMHAAVRDEMFANWNQEEFYHRLDWLYGHRA